MTSLYESDFFAWANEQASLLRAGKLSSADIENIAEEIESMGKSEKRELVSRLTILLLQLLKWQFQPGLRGNGCAPRSRSSGAMLPAILQHLADNPSLSVQLPALLGIPTPRPYCWRLAKQGCRRPFFRTPALGHTGRSPILISDRTPRTDRPSATDVALPPNTPLSASSREVYTRTYIARRQPKGALDASGNGQAVRIPAELAYSETGMDLQITRLGDVITIFPVRKSLKDAVAALRAMPKPPNVENYEPIALPERD